MRAIAVGATVTVNSRGDLMMEREKGRWIGHKGTVHQITKAGLFVVEFASGERETFAKRNLDLAALPVDDWLDDLNDVE